MLTREPLLALSITISLGYLAGKVKVGGFVLGGIAGTLLVGGVVGQLQIEINPGIEAIFFALYIMVTWFLLMVMKWDIRHEAMRGLERLPPAGDALRDCAKRSK